MKNYFIFLIGGLSLFLIGLNSMRESLFTLNSNSLKTTIKKLTNHKLTSFLIGIIFTAIIQSSSGVTAITIAFLSSGLLSFEASVLIILGSNIGTCITPFIFTFNIDKYALLIVVLGYILSLVNRHKIKILGNIIIGLGLIFLGLGFLDYGLNYLSQNILFTNILKNTKSPFLSIIISSFVATILQSSSATIAITQSLYNNQIISIYSALGFMLGANIGTCLASYVLAISSSKEAKLAIKVNIIFNIIGALAFFIFLKPFANLLLFLENYYQLTKSVTIAYSHLIFNITSTLIVFIFFKQFLYVCTKKLFQVPIIF